MHQYVGAECIYKTDENVAKCIYYMRLLGGNFFFFKFYDKKKKGRSVTFLSSPPYLARFITSPPVVVLFAFLWPFLLVVLTADVLLTFSTIP